MVGIIFLTRYQETYEMVRQVVDENGGEVQYTDVCEFLVKQMLGKFHPTDLQLMQVDKLKGVGEGGAYQKLSLSCDQRMRLLI